VGCVFCFFFVFVFWRKRISSIKTTPTPRSNATSPGHPPAPPGLHKPRPSSPPPSPPSLRPSSTAPEVQHQIAAAVQDSPPGGTSHHRPWRRGRLARRCPRASMRAAPSSWPDRVAWRCIPAMWHRPPGRAGGGDVSHGGPSALTRCEEPRDDVAPVFGSPCQTADSNNRGSPDFLDR
jgi:hypothetical protein